MSGMSRRKGTKGEQLVAIEYRAQGFDAARVPNSGGLKQKGDLTGIPEIHGEVKMAGRLDIAAWMRQAEAEAPPGLIPALHWRLCRRGNSTDWYVNVPLDDFIDLLKRAQV